MSYISEYEYHRKKRDTCAKIDLDPISRAKCCDSHVLQQKNLEPMEQLPSEYIVQSKKSRPPRLHYGLAFTSDQLCNYAVKHHLLSEESLNAWERYYGMLDAVEKLDAVTGAPLILHVPRWSAEGRWLVGLYNNYNYSHLTEMGPPDEEVLDILRRELASTATPKWYYTT